MNNTAFLGAGIFFNNAVIADCTVVSNCTHSNGDGGGIYNAATNSQIVNCRVIDNYAMRNGGGIYHNSAVISCLLAGNSAGNYGGGVSQTNTAAMVRSSTIVSNAVVTNGGGVYLGGGLVENSIVYLNTAGIGGSNWTYTAGFFTNTCTAPSVADYGTGNIEDDPLFADFEAGDYRLQSRSPCINAGLNQLWMAGALDLDGNPRIRQRIVDMGAFEGLRDGTVFSVR